MKIPNLNSHRARALYSGGIENLADLANSDVFSIEKILHNSICFDSKKRDGENEWEADQRNNIRFLFVTGKSGTELGMFLIQICMVLFSDIFTHVLQYIAN